MPRPDAPSYARTDGRTDVEPTTHSWIERFRYVTMRARSPKAMSFVGGNAAGQRIQARPTMYRGISMRSRLEATAAGLLDEMGIEWRYEPQCFADGTAQYLPDFQLWAGASHLTWYLEVKPEVIWETWPAPPDSELALALTRMEVIRGSDPGAILMLWMPNTTCSCGGRLVWHWANHPDCRDGWVVSDRLWLATNAEHFRGAHAELSPA